MADVAELTRRLADLAVGLGANVQPGQLVGVTTHPGKEELTRAVARAAYARGARYVDVVTFDSWVKRARVELAAEDTLDFIPPWMSQRLLWLSDERAARISLAGPHAPGALDGVDPARAGRDLLPYLPEVGRVVNARTTSWTIVPAPTAGWAQLVYPGLPAEEALDRLWEAVARMCRLDEPDPVAAWQERVRQLADSAARLNDLSLDAVRLHGPGNDLTIGLLPSSRWGAASDETIAGILHHPNLPTEEVYTTPDPERAEGVVSATMPLELYGSIVEGLRVEFRGGRAVRIDADRGGEALRSAVERAPGGDRLGELALVDREGRIGALGTVFHDTLIDENAATHIALGNGYDVCVGDEADLARVNRSSIHVDFMVGSPELAVDGITRDGMVVPLLREGAWQT